MRTRSWNWAARNVENGMMEALLKCDEGGLRLAVQGAKTKLQEALSGGNR